jgi:hypothetical protein
MLAFYLAVNSRTTVKYFVPYVHPLSPRVMVTLSVVLQIR